MKWQLATVFRYGIISATSTNEEIIVFIINAIIQQYNTL